MSDPDLGGNKNDFYFQNSAKFKLDPPCEGSKWVHKNAVVLIL